MDKMKSRKTTKVRRLEKSSSKRETIEPSSGNVFADLGLPDAEELLAKAELAIQIARLLDQKGWTETEVAQQLGLDRPNVSDLLRGRLSGFSTGRLQAILNHLKA
jgi:predicted XRE-type DNA-binding protein